MEQPERPSLVATVIIGGIVVFVALTLVGWVIGAVLALLRLAAVVAIAVAVIWAISSARSRD